MTMGDQVTVTMTGGGPYGFRLFGGENIPLSVAKIRRRSKSADAGLCEGDILLGINGYSCRGVNHSTAMALAESSGDMLVFQVLRGADDQQSVEAAFQALGDQLSGVPSSALQASAPAAPPAGRPMINSNVTPASQVYRQERTVHENDTMTHVTSETRTETLGDATYRQTTTQRVSQTTLGTASPRRAVSPLQPARQVANNYAPPPRNTWQPPSLQVSAPSGVNVQQNADQSVTMTIGVPIESKENVSPRHSLQLFKVSKATGAQSNGVWTPSGGGGGSAAPKPAPQRSPSPRIAQKWQPPAPALAPSPARARDPSPITVDLGQDVALTPSDFRTAETEEAPMPIDIQKLMFSSYLTGRDSECSTPDSPATLARKKKIYADSSFYDDPEHKYPTIEEQIKMARNVAMSLMAPQNKRARGHTMFMKRRQGSSRWVAGQNPEPYDQADAGPVEEGEKYYRPAPWQAEHTWRPMGGQQQPQVMQPQPVQPQPAPVQQPAPEPYERGWGQPDIAARTWGRTEPVWGGGQQAQPQQPQQPQPQQPQQPQPQPQYQPAPMAAPIRAPTRAPPVAAPATAKPYHTWQPQSAVARPAQPQEPPSWGQAPAPAPAPAQWAPPKASWEPPAAEPPAPAPAPAAPAPPPPPPPPPAPPLPDLSSKNAWRAPKLPSLSDQDKVKSLSYDEFEKVRLLDSKNLHNQVSPQMCFSLANDLRNMKGKGGKLFAKRRARAEQWVVDEHPGTTGPDKNVMEKIAGQVAMEQARQSANLKTQPNLNSGDTKVTHKARLQEMIAKPTMSPWEAAAGGNIEVAFSHLNKRNTVHGDDLLGSGWTPPHAAAPSGGMGPATSLTSLAGPPPVTSVQPQRNDFSRKIKGWCSVGAPASAPSKVASVRAPVHTSAPLFNTRQNHVSSDNTLSPAQPPPAHEQRAPSPRHRAASPRLQAASPRLGAASPNYRTPPQRLSPQAQHPPQSQSPAPATNGEIFYDASEGLPVGCAEGEGYSDL